MANKQEILTEENKVLEFSIIKKPQPLLKSIVSLFYEIYLVKGKSAEFTVNGERLTAKEGCVVAIPPLTPYSCSFQASDKVVQIKIGEKYASRFFEHSTGKVLPFLLDDAHFNTNLLNNMFSLFFDEEFTEHERVAFSETFFSKTAKRYGVKNKENKGDSQTAEIVRYIYENYEKDITLETLAKEFCVSKMVLSRKLSKTLGADLRKFVGDVRVRAYVKMRADKKYSKTTSIELAYKCGFKSYGTFYRAYKRYGE